MPWGSMGSIWAEMGLNYNGLSQGMRDATQQVRAFDREMDTTFKAISANISESLSEAGRSLTIGVTAPLLAMGGFSAKLSSDFETAMANVWTITDISRQELQGLGREVEVLSTRVPQSAKQLADGLYDAISSGIRDVGDAIGVVEIAAKAAQAGMSETAIAVDALTSVLNSYGLAATEAGSITDIMFRTVDRGKITFGELAGSIGQVVSTAATANVAFEEVAAAYATLTRGGINAAEASTAINQAILSIINPSQQAADYAKQLGIEFNATALASKGFAGVLEDIYEATGGNIEAMTTLFPNIRALKGVLGLVRNEMQDYVGDLEQMATATGATEAAFSKQMETSAAKAQLFKNEIAALARSLGNELWPVLISITEALKPIIQAFTDLPAGAKEAAVAWGLFAVALGPVMSGLSALIGLLTGPAGIVLGISAVVAGIYGWVNASRDLEDRIDRQVSSAQRAIREAMEQARAYGEQSDQLGKLIREYEDLEGKPDKSEQEHERLRQVIDAIAQLAPHAVTGYDDMGKALIGNAEAAKRYRDELGKLREQELRYASLREKYELPELKRQAEALQPEIDRLGQQLDELSPLYDKASDIWYKIDYLNRREDIAIRERDRTAQEAIQKQRELLLQEAVSSGVISSTLEPLGIRVDYIRSQYEEVRDTYVDLLNAQQTALKGIVELEGAGRKFEELLAGKSEKEKDGEDGVKDAKKKLSEFEQFGKKVKELSRDIFAQLQDEWTEIGEILKSEDPQDPVIASWAEQRARALLGAIHGAIAQFEGDWTKAAEAAAKEVASGYESIKEKAIEGQSELSKALSDFRHRVAIGKLVGFDAQLEELERIKSTYKGNAEEVQRVDEQLYRLREQMRSQSVRDALDQYRIEADLYDFKAADHVKYLKTRLTLYTLNADEEKQISRELQLWEKRLAEETLAYKKKINDGWNQYFVDSGRKARADYLREELEKRQRELEIARTTNEGVEAAKIAVANAQLTLNAQLRQDDEDRVRHLVRMDAMKTAAQLDQIESWLRAETEATAHWKNITIDKRNELLERQLGLQKQLNLEAAKDLQEQMELALGNLAKLTTKDLDLLRDWRLRLGEAMEAAKALGVEGADAASFYEHALRGINEQIDRLEDRQSELDFSKLRTEYADDPDKETDAYRQALEKRLAVAEKYSNDWQSIIAEIERVDTESNKRRAEAGIKALGDFGQMTIEELDGIRDALLVQQTEYEGLGKVGKAAATEIANALDEVKKTQRNLFDEMVERGKLTTEEQLKHIGQWLAGAKRGTDEYARLASEQFRLQRQLQTELAEAKVTEQIGIMPEDIKQLDQARMALGTFYDEAKKMGPLGEDAANKYAAALNKIEQQSQKLATEDEKRAAEAIQQADNQAKREYERNERSLASYKQHLEDRMAALEAARKKHTGAWMQYDRELAALRSTELKDAAQATIDSLGDLETVYIPSAKRILEAERDRYAALADGAQAVKSIDVALQELTKRELAYAQTMSKVDDQIRRSYEERLQKVVDAGTAMLAEAERNREDTAQGWAKYQAEVDMILTKVALDAGEIHAEQAREQVAAANEISKTNHQAALETLQGWRQSYEAMGLAGEQALKVIDEALDDLKAKAKDAGESLDLYLESRRKDPLAATLEALDKEREERAKLVTDQAKLDEWYYARVEEEVEQALQTRIGAVNQMSEVEVRAAQVTLDTLKGLIIKRLGAESEAAAEIEAIQAELYQRLDRLAIEQADRKLQLLRQIPGAIDWQTELQYLEDMVLLDAETKDARMNRAAQYYSAVSRLARGMKEEELKALQAVLRQSLATFSEMGEGGEELAMAILALLGLIDKKFAETAKTASQIAKETAQSIQEIADSLSTLAGMFGAGSELQSGIRDLGRAIGDGVQLVASIGTGDVLGAITSGISMLANFGSAIDNLSPSVRAAKAEFRAMGDEIRRSLSGLDRFGHQASVQLTGLARSYQSQLEQWQRAAESRANAGFFTRAWWGLTGSAPSVGSKAGREAAQAFIESWKSIAGALESGVASSLQRGIKSFIDGTKRIADVLREGIRNAIIEAITQAMIQGALIQGALGALLGQLTDELAQRQWAAAQQTIQAIANEIPEVAAGMEQLLKPLADTLNAVLPSPEKASGGGKSGTQISEITGPTRDLLVETLRPLTVLDSLPVYAMAMETAIYEMRDAFLAYIGTKAATEAGMGAIHNEYHINTIQIYSSGKEDFDQLMTSLNRRAEIALLGSGA